MNYILYIQLNNYLLFLLSCHKIHKNYFQSLVCFHTHILDLLIFLIIFLFLDYYYILTYLSLKFHYIYYQSYRLLLFHFLFFSYYFLHQLNFISPSLTQPIFFKNILMIGQITAGRIMDTRSSPAQSPVVIAALVPSETSLTQPVYTPI